MRAFAAGTLLLDDQGHTAGKWQGQGQGQGRDDSLCCVLFNE